MWSHEQLKCAKVDKECPRLDPENPGGVRRIHITGHADMKGMYTDNHLLSANRAEEATLEALHSPLLELDTTDARGALINVVGGSSLTLGEAEKCAQIIQEQVSPHAKIIWGAAVDESLGDEIRVMLVLTGVKSEQIHGSSENRQLRALRNKSIEFVN